MRKIHILSCFMLLMSCSNTKETVETINESKILIKEIALERMDITYNESSFEGRFYIEDTLIYFVDKRFGWFTYFNKNGDFLYKKLGQGEGPNELNTSYIDGYVKLKDNSHFILGSSFDIHLYDQTLYRTKTKILDWKGNKNSQEVRSNPLENLNEFALYTLDYMNLHIKEDNKGNLYFPIYIENEKFNAFTGKKYYTDAYILAKYNIRKNKVVDLLGHRSEKYMEYKYLGQHAYFNYDIGENSGKFYVNHEIDPSIYVYDDSFNELIRFGIAGKEMNTAYQELETFDLKAYRDLYMNDKPKRGWYHQINVFDDQGYVFRSYHKGNTSEFDGLQIYKDFVLIADLDVPKWFTLTGYIHPYFYGEQIPFMDENEEFKLYRFKL